jgi:RimJ/RimL family protein N-acetyltransferase
LDRNRAAGAAPAALVRRAGDHRARRRLGGGIEPCHHAAPLSRGGRAGLDLARARADEAETAFVITLAKGRALIGACGIGPATWTEGRQIGYWLGAPYWRRGYATEAARAMVDLAFGSEKLAHLWCSCRVTNEGSRGVIHKCGFQFHSAGMMFMRAAGASVPVEHYCLDRSVWLAFNRWRAA